MKTPGRSRQDAGEQREYSRRLRFFYQPMLRPPSTAMIWPVTKGASQTTKRTSRATSRGSPARPSGVFERIAFFTCSGGSGSAHITMPGAMPLTRTSGASSPARLSVSEASPAFAALYTG